MLRCATNTCIVRWNGDNEFIYRISELICVGEEICWDFIDMVSSMKCNFSAFCYLMNSSYKRHSSAKKFMSVKTFIKVFFSWASNQQNDFREACNWCGNSPKILACDGTKIGICATKASVEPVEKTNNEIPLKTEHKKNDRCFLSYPPNDGSLSTKERTEEKSKIQEARAHLKFMMKNVGNISGRMEDHDLTVRTEVLLAVFPTQCKPLLTRILTQNLSMEQLASATRFFYMLSYEAPLRAFLPKPLLDATTVFIESSFNYQNVNDYLQLAKKYNVYIHDFVNNFTHQPNYAMDEDAKKVLDFLCQKAISLHQNDIAPEAATPITHSYDPPKLGRAYYFNQSGTQIRESRKFEIDGAKTNDSSQETCSKKYPQVAKKGSTFLFLWFCPLHGHCYGGHIVNGAEGRKDPACSLYTHLEVAPEIIYYDFACSLEEYCMNREAGYFKNTQFFYDIFHGYNHTCSKIYSSKKLQHLNSINSSICEQFNSYLQCIKSSAKQMSQEHFMFFLQYMIRLWNQKKKKSFLQKLKIALSGSL